MLASLFLWRWNPSPLEADVPGQPVVVAVTTLERQVSGGVELLASRVPAIDFVTGRAGVITASALTPLTAVETGAEVLRVNNLPVFALRAKAPMYRDLKRGDRGDDVLAVQNLLVARGYLSGRPDGAFGDRTARAVARFAEHFERKKAATFFEAQWVMWVADGAGPQSIDLGVGSTVSPGGVVAKGQSLAQAITVSESPQAKAITGPATLSIGAVTVPYVPGSGAVKAQKDVAALMSVIGSGTEAAAGTVTAAKTAAVAVIPASAVVTGASGSPCVFVDATGPPVGINPVDSDSASVFLAVKDAPTAVLANPSVVRPGATCA